MINETLRSNHFDLDEDYIEEALKSGHFAIFLDGFDEVPFQERKTAHPRYPEIRKEIREKLADFIIKT